MKRNWKGIALVVVCCFVNGFVSAQVRDTVKEQDRYRTGTEKDKDNSDDDMDRDKDRNRDIGSDREMHERLSQNLYSRMPATKDAVIVWDNTDDGYEGAYAVGKDKYLALYDKNGNYVMTLLEKDWDKDVPDNVRRNYESSAYKSGKVKRFWEVKEPNRQGYYLEIKDDNGNSRRLWSDKDGKFSESRPDRGNN